MDGGARAHLVGADGVNAWLIANRFGIGHSVAASTISISTATGVLSVSLWAWLLS